MFNHLLFAALLLLALDVQAALGDGDQIDYIPIPGELCNADSDSKQRDLFQH